MSAEKFRTVPLLGFSRLTEIRLYDETVDHIVEEHEEFRLQLPSYHAGFLTAIQNPDRLYSSTTGPGLSFVLVSKAFTYFGDPLRVPIKVVEGTSGRVQTAHFSSETYGGQVVWNAKHD